MTLARFKELAMLPGVFVALLVALAWLLTLMRTGERLENHVVQETTYHRLSDSSLRELHGHLLDIEKSQEAQLRGECIENPKKDLARQGLLAKCRQLGIER